MENRREKLASFIRHAGNYCSRYVFEHKGTRLGAVAGALYQPLRNIATVIRSGRPADSDPYL